MNTLKVGTIGANIELDTGLDLRNATVLKIQVVKPDGTSTDWQANVKADEPTVMTYTTKSGDLSLKGTYRLKCYIASPLWTGTCDMTTMRVDPA